MRHFDTGQARHRGLKQIAVAAQIVEQGIEPWLAVAIRGERSLIAEQSRVVHRLLQVRRESLAQSDILDDREGEASSRDIEGLRRCHQRDGAARYFGRE